jgi:aminoglycoside phosphotransferase (APT) family kinase protein
MFPIEPLAAYETLPPPSVSDAELRAIVERHRIELDGPVIRLRSSGVVHSLWALGSKWVLRVPKNETMCLGDHRCEAIAIPLALRAGVRTPELYVFDDSSSILDVPFSIVSRVHGADLSTESFRHPSYAQVGSELGKLHVADLATSGHPWLRRPSDPPAEDFFDRVVQAGLLHADGVAWIAGLCDQLHGVVAQGSTPPCVFLHGDVKPDNVMIEPSGGVLLIDWGDAGFGDPAYDFQSLSMHSIEIALSGYREVVTDDPTLEARIVQRVVARCLSNLCRTPLTGPSWYRPVAANLTDLLTFALDHRPVFDAWLQL